jgi:WhiB family redox-sensing transcriptional regulator
MSDDDFESIDDTYRSRTGIDVSTVDRWDGPATSPALVPVAYGDDRADRARTDEDDDRADEVLVGPDGRPELSLVDLTGGLTGLSGLTPEDPGWQELALCAQTDPEAFFPEKGGSTREAKRVCQSCEVRQECLEYALGNDERFGIWGGLSERERRRLKRHIG